MKKLLGLLPIILCVSCAAPSGRQVSYDGIVRGVSAPQTLQWLGESFEAKYSASDATKALVEYYRSDEGPKSWTRMLALRLNEAGPSSRQQVENMERNIRQGGNSAVASYSRKDADGYGIDFILTTRGYQELSVFRYIDRTNTTGTVSFQYAEIIPREDLHAVAESKRVDYLKNLRWKAVKAMWAVSVPVIEKVPEDSHAQTNGVGR